MHTFLPWGVGPHMLHPTVSPTPLARVQRITGPGRVLLCPTWAGVVVLQSLLTMWNQSWHFCFLNQFWTIISLFKSLPVLSHVPQVLIDFGLVSISGLSIFFLLTNPQTILFANDSFLQTQNLDEAAYNRLHWNSTAITMNMSCFCSNW